MAKVYLIITMVRGNKAAGENAMLYPEAYKPFEIDANKQGPIIYEGAFSRGQASEECMVFIEKAVADKYKADDPERFRVVPKAAADQWLAQNQQLQEQPEERVTDVDRMIAIQAKVAAGVVLSQEDLDALDPDNPIRGINRRPKTAVGIFGPP